MISGAMRWFGNPWGAPMNDDCEHVAVPVGDPCSRCDEPIQITDRGVLMWHIDAGGGQYRPLHYACFMRQTTGGIGHILMHGTQPCQGECPPDPDWLPRRLAAEIAEGLWQYARRVGR